MTLFGCTTHVEALRIEALRRAIRALPETMPVRVPSYARMRYDDSVETLGLMGRDGDGALTIDLAVLLGRFLSERESVDDVAFGELLSMDIDEAPEWAGRAEGAAPEHDGDLRLVGGGVMTDGTGSVLIMEHECYEAEVDLFCEEGDGLVDLRITPAPGTRLRSIGELAFAGCSSIASAQLPPTLTDIQFCAFAACSRLRRIALPSGVERIYPGAFACSGIEEISWPDRCPEIPAYAFAGCVALRSVRIPEGVRSVGPRAFWGCASLSSVTLPKSCDEVADSAFERTAVTTVF